jgi:Flp pilus assembly protein TadG
MATVEHISAKPISEKRRRRSAGNAMVESVFTLLPTFALIFFMTDVGLMTFRWSTLQNAVREGSRLAVTFGMVVNGVTYTNQDAAIKAMVQQYGMNLVTSTDSPQHIFVNYYLQSANTAAIPTTNSGDCGTASAVGNCPGNIVEVSVSNFSLSWILPLTLSGSFGNGLERGYTSTPITLAVYSSDVLGGFPLGVTSVTR